MVELRQKLIKDKNQKVLDLPIVFGVLVILLSLGETSGSSITVYEQILGSLIIIVFFLTLFKFLTRRKVEIPKVMLYWILFGCLTIVNILLAIFNGVEVIWWFRRFFPIFTLLVFALFSFVELNSIKRIFIIYIILILVAVFGAIHSLIYFPYNNFSVISSFQNIRKFSGGYYNAFTLSLVFPFLFRHIKHHLWRVLIYLSFTIGFIGLFLSFTRTSWISSAISILFALYLLSKVKHKKCSLFPTLRRIAFITIVIMTIMGISLAYKNKIFLVSLVSHFNLINSLKSLSFQDRLFEAKGLLHTMFINPLTILSGNGFGAKFAYYCPNPFRETGIGWINTDYTHNYYLFLLFNTGIFGLSLFLTGWISLILRIRKVLIIFKDNSEWIGNYILIGIAASIINLLAASLTGPPLMNFVWGIYFGLLIGSGLNLAKIAQARLKGKLL